MIDKISHFLHVTPWDWTAVIIALLSLVIAIFSLYVTYKTLLSQRETADNTAPVINVEIQKFLLEKMFVNLIDAYVNNVIHQKLIDEVNYELYKTEEVSINQFINNDSIHLELFYDNKPIYQSMRVLYEQIDTYNANLSILKSLIHDNKSLDKKIALMRLERLRKQCQLIILKWKVSMMVLFNDPNIIETVERNFSFSDAIDPTEKERDLKDSYDFNNKLIKYLLINDIELNKSLIIVMNQRARILEEDYRKYLLD